jgi:hypothetical protein
MSRFPRTYWLGAACIAAAAIVAVAAAARAHAQGPGGPNGVDILIRAENRSISDVPWCGTGPGQVGDRLTVDAFMNQDGVVTGQARFEAADGTVTLIPLDRMFGFAGNFFPANGGGFLVQNNANQNTVPIWTNDVAVNPVLVNVELPRGCQNTVSTFTAGLDKVTVELKFR